MCNLLGIIEYPGRHQVKEMTYQCLLHVNYAKNVLRGRVNYLGCLFLC